MIRTGTVMPGAMMLAAAMIAAPARASSSDNGYPAIPEPMVFDMMRPLGAAKGELEVNTLAQVPLSGDPQTVFWAPEIEYAFADGMAIEFELPFEDRRLSELKLGLQGAFGAFNGGRSAHGVQYLGIYDRAHQTYSSSIVYMLGHRFDDRLSMMSMVGIGDVRFSNVAGTNAVLVNHTTFLNTSDATVLGFEVNWRSGDEGGILLMPQIHQKIATSFNIQAGIGLHKARDEPARPRAGLRVIREF